MQVLQSCGKVFGVHLTSKERKALRIEIRKQLLELEKKYADDFDATLLYYLYVRYGFEKEDLRQFWEGFHEPRTDLAKYYEMEQSDSEWLCTQKLLDIGVDIKAWNKERGD